MREEQCAWTEQGLHLEDPVGKESKASPPPLPQLTGSVTKHIEGYTHVEWTCVTRMQNLGRNRLHATLNAEGLNCIG